MADDDPLLQALADPVEGDLEVPEAPYEAGDHDALPWIDATDPQLVPPDRGDPMTREEEAA